VLQAYLPDRGHPMRQTDPGKQVKRAIQ
jgi:hypothetical protein